jgi:hypothetical protein
LGPFLEIIKDVIKNWSLDYKENYVDILNNTEYVNPNIKSFALLPTYPTKYMHKAWESKTKTLRDIVVYHKRGETVLFTYLKKPACTFDNILQRNLHETRKRSPL